MTEVIVPQGENDGTYTYGIDEDGNLLKKHVEVQEVDQSGRYHAKTYSGTSNNISIGSKYFVLDTDDPNFRVGDDVLIRSNIEPTLNFMWGEIIGSDTTVSPRRLLVYVDDISDAIGTGIASWTLQVVGRPKPGIEKDTSTSSVNPTAAGPFTLTVTAGKFFPIDGTLLLKPTADRTIALLATVKAYAGTSLVIEKTTTNATVSTSYTSWAVALLDGPKSTVLFQEVTGLQVVKVEFDPDEISVYAGVVRDSTDTIDLRLPSALTKVLSSTFVAGNGNGAQVYSANLAGTVSNTGTAVTGTGTDFNPDFLDGHNYCITVGAVTEPTTGTASDTALTIEFGALGASGSTYKRGGWPTNGAWTTSVTYYVSIVRKDSDGSTDIIVSQGSDASGNPVPDLPSGYTYYRALAVLDVVGGVITAVDTLITDVEYEAYVVYTNLQNVLPRHRVLTAGTGITLTNSASAKTLTISTTPRVTELLIAASL